MVLKIIWSEFAETQLDEIYDYYEKKTSPRIAKKTSERDYQRTKKVDKNTSNWTRRGITKAKRNSL